MPRLAAIDQLRAIAVLMMMLAHFGPGALERIPALAPHMAEILFISKLATVSFILTFGLTLGYVHYERFHSDRARTVTRLRKRFLLVLACAILTFTPNYAALIAGGETDPIKWMFASYSVLNFYVLAFALSVAWLLVLGSNPVRNAAILGIALWFSGWALLQVWPSTGQTTLEYVRVNLVSGPYALLQLGGAATLAIAVGVLLRRSDTNRFALWLIPFGLALTLAGLALGTALDELSLQAVVSGEAKAPPRLWYWLLFSGMTVALFSALLLVERNIPISRTLLYPLSLFGQAALPIYALHVLVLPGLYLLDRTFELTGTMRIVAPFVALAIGIAIIMVYYHPRKQHA
jgi:uncharacterized membrane protein